MSDVYADRMRAMSDPAASVFEILPDDGQDLPYVTTGLNVATPGTVRITTTDGTTSDLFLTAGQIAAVRAKRVWLTGTTATGIRGLF